MPETRSSAGKTKSQQDCLSKLCKSLITKTTQEGFFNDIPRCISSYLRLVEYRNGLEQLREIEFQSLLNSTNEFEKLEGIDRHCIMTFEQLSSAPSG